MSNSRRRWQKLPVESVTMTIDRLSHEGRGVASNQGKIAFVEGALPFEQVTATYTSRRSQYDEFKLQEVLVSSPQRVTPPCAVADICGGCLLQHMSPLVQIEFKQQVLLDQLKHTAGIVSFELLPPLAANPESYRRKARLAVRYVHKRQEVLVGFREKANTFITDMTRCEVLVKPVGRLISPLRELILAMESCREIPQIEVAVGETSCVSADKFDEHLHVALILRHLQPLSEADLEQLRQFADTYAIDWYLQSGGPETVHKFWPDDGKTALRYFLPDVSGDHHGNSSADIVMEFQPGDFTQVNAGINRMMINQALDLLDLQPEDRVLDLFCGLGNFTLPIGRRCAQVCGVEGSDELVIRAGENATRNAIGNATFYKADLFSEFSAETWARPHYNKLLLDPPRSGAIEIVSHIRELSPQIIVYVSCNPATFARDAAELQRQGYVMTHAGVMDMFPHTGHVESMARFELCEKKPRKSQKQAI
jgi:23S rRNA (uracil1939-C5)-methyltransferase